MIIVRISRAPFLFRPWMCELQEAGIIEVVLSFNDDSDRQQNQSDFQMVCYDSLFLSKIQFLAQAVFYYSFEKP